MAYEPYSLLCMLSAQDTIASARSDYNEMINQEKL